MKTPELSHIERYLGARLLRVPVGTGELASQIDAFERAIRRQLESESYALVHVTDPFGGAVLLEERTQHGFRLIYEAQYFAAVDLPLRAPEVDPALVEQAEIQERRCLLNADAVITGSGAMRESLVSMGILAERITTLPSPVETAAFIGSPREPTPTGGPLRILCLGESAPWEDVPTLLQATARVLSQGPVSVTLAGPLTERAHAALDAAIQELELRAHVTWVGPLGLKELPPLLARADVGVMALTDIPRNHLCASALDAASELCAAGLPLIAADLPISRQELPPGGTLFVRAGDASALAEQLLALARDPERRAALGRNSLAHAEAFFEAGVVQAALLALYGELLGTPLGATPVAPALPPVPRLRNFTAARVLHALNDAPDTPPPVRPPGPRQTVPTADFLGPEAPTLVGPPPQPDPSTSPDVPPPVSSAVPAEVSTRFWKNQILLGYCPPEDGSGVRPTPPTNFPGRDPGPQFLPVRRIA